MRDDSYFIRVSQAQIGIGSMEPGITKGVYLEMIARGFPIPTKNSVSSELFEDGVRAILALGRFNIFDIMRETQLMYHQASYVVWKLVQACLIHKDPKGYIWSLTKNVSCEVGCSEYKGLGVDACQGCAGR